MHVVELQLVYCPLSEGVSEDSAVGLCGGGIGQSGGSVDDGT